MDKKRGLGFWILISIGMLLILMFLLGQTLSLVDYDLTVSLGLQESEEEISNVGIAYAKGFAFGDTIFYIPLFVIGIVGLLKRKIWGLFSMIGALAVSIYWPIVHLFAIFIGKDAMNLMPEKYVSYSIILSIIILYGLWGIWFLYKNQNRLNNETSHYSSSLIFTGISVGVYRWLPLLLLPQRSRFQGSESTIFRKTRYDKEKPLSISLGEHKTCQGTCGDGTTSRDAGTAES